NFLTVPCLIWRETFATLVLTGVKALESRWRPLLSELRNCTLGEHWRLIFTERLEMTAVQTEELLKAGEGFGRGVIAGLVYVGETWCCPEDIPCEEMRELETAACLTELRMKYLTRLSNPQWLNEPIYSSGHKDVWTVSCPLLLLIRNSETEIICIQTR
uniref:Uncharacterized protein n=1 Tax=Cyprinus carpio carpio TaxID=630221 RepID=A0A9J7YDP8_CYPCA